MVYKRKRGRGRRRKRSAYQKCMSKELKGTRGGVSLFKEAAKRCKVR